MWLTKGRENLLGIAATMTILQRSFVDFFSNTVSKQALTGSTHRSESEEAQEIASFYMHQTLLRKIIFARIIIQISENVSTVQTILLIIPQFILHFY